VWYVVDYVSVQLSYDAILDLKLAESADDFSACLFSKRICFKWKSKKFAEKEEETYASGDQIKQAQWNDEMCEETNKQIHFSILWSVPDWQSKQASLPKTKMDKKAQTISQMSVLVITKTIRV
jgi:hypothetical protein